MSKVLVVDDRDSETELLKAYLEDSVDEVRALTDSRQIEEVFAEFEPDVVILDLHMPDPDGFEAVRRLRGARSGLGFLPVLVLTHDESHVAPNSAFILGADESLTKQDDREDLVLRVPN